MKKTIRKLVLGKDTLYAVEGGVNPPHTFGLTTSCVTCAVTCLPNCNL